MAAGAGIAPTLPVLQTGVQTHYTIQRFEMVLPRGNAPRSFGYRPKALLLSYRRHLIPFLPLLRRGGEGRREEVFYSSVRPVTPPSQFSNRIQKILGWP